MTHDVLRPAYPVQAEPQPGWAWGAAVSLAVPPEHRKREVHLPRDSSGLALMAAVVVVITVLFAWFTLWSVRGTFVKAAQHSLVVDAVLVLFALLPLALFRFVGRGWRESMRFQSARGQGDAIQARVSNANARESAWAAMGWAAGVLMVYAFALLIVANDAAVGGTFFNLEVIFGSFGLVARAFITNIIIFCLAEVFILIWGLLVAVARMVPGEAGRPIRAIATFYTDAFRGLPSIITIYLVGFGLPLAGLPFFSDGNLFTPTIAAVFALTLTYGAYVAEVYRAGIESIHPSQFAAARSLGLNFFQTMRFVIVPQAVRRIIPPLLNDFIGLQKDTALVNVIGTIDAFNQAKIIASNKFNLSAVTIVAILFVLITIPQARLVDRLLEREQQRTRN